MADETLLLLVKEIRGKTQRILQNVTEAQARFAPPGLCNTILWHAGHTVVVNEHLGVSPISGKPPGYPPDWFAKFSWESKPATIKEWPALAEVAAAHQQQTEKLLSLISNLSEGELAKVTDPARGRTLRFSIFHGLHDEADHQGEMWLLKKLQAHEAKH